MEPPVHTFGDETQIRFNISEGNPLYLLESIGIIFVILYSQLNIGNISILIIE